MVFCSLCTSALTANHILIDCASSDAAYTLKEFFSKISTLEAL